MIREERANKAAALAAITSAFAQSPAILGHGYGKPMMAIKSGELSDLDAGTLRVTFFGPDGPHGHSTRKTDREIAEEVATTMKGPFRPMDDDDVMAWQSTPEFQRGSRLVAFVQAENTIRWLASKAGRSEWATEQVNRANEIGTRDGTVNSRGLPDDLDALDKAIAILQRGIAELPHQNPANMDEQVVTPEGEVCVLKDCCVLICENVVTPNPGRGAFTDRSVIDPAFDAVCKGVEKYYGLAAAEKVASALYSLPIVYNARLSRAVGRAKFVADGPGAKPTVIELTGSVDIPADYMHGLLVHEGCHVAHCIIAGPRFAYEQSHGRQWQGLMVAAGAKPEAKCYDPRLLNMEKEAARFEKTRLRKGGPAVRLHEKDFAVGDIVSFIHKDGKYVSRIIAKEPEQAYVVVLNENNTPSHVKAKIGYGLLTKEQP